MRRFAQLYAELDASTATEAKLAALQRYLADADPADAAWGIYFLAGGKPQQSVPTAVLRSEAMRQADIPDWLFDTCYQAVGDLAETIALVLPPPRRRSALGLSRWLTERLLPLRGVAAADQAAALAGWWDELLPDQRFLLTKLIGGGLRVGVSRLLVQRALARHAGLDPKLVAQRLMGWTAKHHLPTAAGLQALMAAPAEVGNAADLPAGQPFPFFLAHPLDQPLAGLEAALGPVSLWLAEWKYDGIRAQVVRTASAVWLWSRGEELISDHFPEVLAWAQALPAGSVLDGELLAWQAGRPAPFKLLQQRLNRKTVSRALLASAPVRFMAYDLLAWQGQDQRSQTQAQRRGQLQALLAAQPGHLSPRVEADSWPALAQRRDESRARGVEGLMLKRLDSAYGSGRTKADGLWWKWKLAPHTVDAVLVYAQAGHGRRAGLYTDYTFAVWNRPPSGPDEAAAVVAAIEQRLPPQPGALQLLAFAKAYSGLTDAEFRQVDQVIRQHTLEKFGPVRSVRPTLVFELAFEGIAASARHKSGVALRFPRLLRIRHDKPLHQADSLASLQGLLSPPEPGQVMTSGAGNPAPLAGCNAQLAETLLQDGPTEAAPVKL